tara:strand:- start:233 stop:472 length:240 start_codon:yes stop_codon:yes gene_type:complete
MSKKYVIINTSEVSSVDFSEVLETSEFTLNFSNDDTETFVKFDTDTTPSFLEGKTQYNHSQMIEILATENWKSSNIPPE